MKYRNHTVRCVHSIAVNIPGVRCPACHPRLEDLEGGRSKRKSPAFRMTPGTTVVGVQILRRINNDRVEARCWCGKIYEPSRSMIRKHNKRGTIAICPACVRAESEQKKRGAA